MAMRPRNKKGKGNSHAKQDTFISIPNKLVESELFSSLSGVSIKVLIKLIAQYNSYNNGNLSAPRSQLKEWGIGSPNTLQKALEELQAKGLIVLTRQGYFTRSAKGSTCNLYAICWHPINQCKGKNLEIEPTQGPYKSIYQILRDYENSIK